MLKKKKEKYKVPADHKCPHMEYNESELERVE